MIRRRGASEKEQSTPQLFTNKAYPLSLTTNSAEIESLRDLDSSSESDFIRSCTKTAAKSELKTRPKIQMPGNLFTTAHHKKN